MKTLAIILLVVCAVVVTVPVEGRNVIDYGVINECYGPNPPPGCHPPGAKNRVPANDYHRGCTKVNRCYRE
ncbi:hypothetical protein EUTSA_v10023138mg [Eutrema salsugineum]|uniref:Uncharacterized protein n=1 Tax=Eutrema salsugineum TaxID=72664 RepID=V4MDJ2_EUTSA|nr:protein RALF-like 11 [Eutrema salsugineum]ESQ50543.1 hypothetical protein EUTSA_v10023138mg [Eutrema salsugineum]